MKISNDSITWKYARLLLDTCALFKLLVPEFKEPGTQNLESYLEPGIKLHSCDYCIGEVMGILKREWKKKKITTDGYFIIINRLIWKINNKSLVLHKLPLEENFNELIQLVKKYKKIKSNIDYIDALLLNHFLNFKSYDLFVTADGPLSKAARDEGALCWNIVDCATPPE